MDKNKYLSSSVAQVFEQQVKKNPNAIAVEEQHKSLSYASLNASANRLAAWLQKRGIQHGDIVAVLLEPGIDFISMILAIIKTGASYLPIDAAAPPNRQKTILEESRPAALIGSHLLPWLETPTAQFLNKNIHLESIAYSSHNPQVIITPDSAFYTMYTSGTTGRPKGIVVPHQAILNLMKIENTVQLKPGDRSSQTCSLAFDGSSFEIWSALLNGATMVIVDQEERINPEKFASFLRQKEINFSFLPTSFFHHLIHISPEILNPLSSIMVGGEALRADLVVALLEYRNSINHPLRLINGYGPTEATCYVTRNILTEKDAHLSHDALTNIGEPVKNAKAYILNADHQLDDEGELYVSGVNLALGYYKSPELNQKTFVDNPYSEESLFQKMYKTGDKVRRLDDGKLFYLGRLDEQVKIGGFRIYLNEIEECLVSHPMIHLAAVSVETNESQHKLLTAYLIANQENQSIHAEEIREYLSHKLPPYMLPVKYVLLESFPLTSIGKVDKKKLNEVPHIDLTCHIDTIEEYEIEKSIKTIWCRLLGVASIDVNKNIFDLGANSLLLAEATNQINQALKTQIKISDVLAYPTTRKLSDFIEGHTTISGRGAPQEKVLNRKLAVVGLSCRFPGADSVEEFWNNLCTGQHSITRFDQEALQTRPTADNDVPCRGILKDIESFDAHFFGFNPADATITDPQQRLFLECSWEALESAGIVPDDNQPTSISVFSGMLESSYLKSHLLKNNWFVQHVDAFHQRLATSTEVMATQLSYRLNLTGRSINTNTACSTGLVTIIQACEDLMNGACDVAIAGAASIAVPQAQGYPYHKGSITSPDGVCRPFSSEANGTVFSNGVGVVVLKRLEDAKRDQNPIYAVIEGYGMNNDGSDKLGYTAPSVSGQSQCIISAIEASGVAAEDIEYVEAHGTATALGDVIEIESLTKAYRAFTNEKNYCAIGSVKGNIGHLDIAAGMAGFIKAVLCTYHHQIPPTLHFNEANPDLNLDKSPFYVNTDLVNWRSKKKNRYAAVSAFGMGGTNAHVIIGEHRPPPAKINDTEIHIMPVSAKTLPSLEHNKERLLHFLKSGKNEVSPSYLNDVSYTLQQGRKAFKYRTFGIGRTLDECEQDIQQREITDSIDARFSELIFMFPGQGMQYYGMGAQLKNKNSLFSQTVEQCVQLANPYLNTNLWDLITDPKNPALHQTQYAQPALFIMEYALAKLLIHYRLTPAAYIGHSIGEYVAACLSGVFSLEDAIALVCQRGMLMSSASPGAMLSIECTRDEFLALQKTHDVDLALHNGFNRCVAAGSFAEIDKLKQFLQQKAKKAHKLNVSHAFHSRLMNTIEAQFIELFDNITLHPPHTPYISNVTGNWISSSEAMDPQYWFQHLRQTVQLYQGFENILKDKQPFLVEIGPGNSMSVLLRQCARHLGKTPITLSTLPGQPSTKDEWYSVLDAIGTLWQHGCHIEWSKLHGQQQGRLISLPTYAFDKQRYWLEPDCEADALLPAQTSLYHAVWYRENQSCRDFDIPDKEECCWIIFKTTDQGISEQIQFELGDHQIQPIIVEHGAAFQHTNNHHYLINFADKEHYKTLLQAIKGDYKKVYILHTASLHSDTDGTDIADLDFSFYSGLYLTQSYYQTFGDSIPLHLFFFTSGTQRIFGTENMMPLNASLLGIALVIGEEHANYHCLVVDIEDHAAFPAPILPALYHYNAQQQGKTQTQRVLAYRQNHFWRKDFIPLTMTSEKTKLRHQGVYLFSGGTGGIALSLCHSIAKEVQSPVCILVSRNATEFAKHYHQWLQDETHPKFTHAKLLKKVLDLGATVDFYDADIGAPDSLHPVIETILKKYPTINGLIHTAGLPGGGLLQLKQNDDISKVFQAKVQGTINLARALKPVKTNFVLLCSSIVSIVGEPGQSDYTAANACLDAFAESNLFNSESTMSVCWNTWRDIGMAWQKGHDDMGYFERGNDISPETGQQKFLEVLKQHHAQVIVSNKPIDKLNRAIHQKSVPPRFNKTNVSRSTLNLSSQASPPKDEFEKEIVTVWQVELGIDDIGRHDNFFDLGGHSLKALAIIEKLNRKFNSTISINHTYEAPTPASLATLIRRSLATPNKSEIVVNLKKTDSAVSNVFLCHPISGMLQCFEHLVPHFPDHIAVYGLQDPSISKDTLIFDNIHDMAKAYQHAIQSIQPHGPYHFVGYSFGGSVLYEVAHLLMEQREKIDTLILIDSWATLPNVFDEKETFHSLFQDYQSYLSERLITQAWQRVQMLKNYHPTNLAQPLILLKANKLLDFYKEVENPTNGWNRVNSGAISVWEVDGDHETMLNKVNSQTIGFKLLEILNINRIE
ncbi:MAG: amino acid adenylation domain-containing protein [Legionellaceae bacterium]|nr:amino acid adenylation domain-containing protein [Legionellaceae bacterium]